MTLLAHTTGEWVALDIILLVAVLAFIAICEIARGPRR